MNECKNCGETTKNKVYCSRSCAATVNNKKHPKKKAAELNSCKQCGKATKNSIYCSNTCQQARQRVTAVEEGDATWRQLKSYMLLDQKIKSCSVCSLDEWNGMAIPLEIDHIDGNHTNNAIENVRLICPNCHAQTDTYKNRNKGNGRHIRRTRYREGKSY